MSFIIKIIELSIVYPILFQTIFGTLRIWKKIKIPFKKISLISITSQFIVSILFWFKKEE